MRFLFKPRFSYFDTLGIACWVWLLERGYPAIAIATLVAGAFISKFMEMRYEE